ncbi:PREDICTED: uncharacterized protein LOC106310259 [Brassica oleracea var. oleracea]|uniref:uncharacterized protein LOC106310259 n=1 Tax=Brassica oleracea var. oleracea TaxID=109376 RepID=UPI0006A6A13D|nr:PREDICTED: uncharacterized protein LOC106310259 [Brassica oleracea var. oleracea]
MAAPMELVLWDFVSSAVRYSAHHRPFRCATSRGHAFGAASTAHPFVTASSVQPSVAVSSLGACKFAEASQLEGGQTGSDPSHLLDYVLHPRDLLPSTPPPPELQKLGSETVSPPLPPLLRPPFYISVSTAPPPWVSKGELSPKPIQQTGPFDFITFMFSCIVMFSSFILSGSSASVVNFHVV